MPEASTRRSVLSATCVPRTRSYARYTAPMLPSPRQRSTTKRPARTEAFSGVELREPPLPIPKTMLSHPAGVGAGYPPHLHAMTPMLVHARVSGWSRTVTLGKPSALRLRGCQSFHVVTHSDRAGLEVNAVLAEINLIVPAAITGQRRHRFLRGLGGGLVHS